MPGGRSSKQKGLRHERGLVKLLLEHGFKAERTPLSGALGNVKWGGGADVTVPLFGREHRIECKHHASGFLKLYRWLVGCDLLVVKADRSEPLVVMPLSNFLEIAKNAEQIGEQIGKAKVKRSSGQQGE
jgi:Holliday junction resolvase